MDWRLPALAVALIVLLAGASAIVEQVETEIANPQDFAKITPPADFTPPVTPPIDARNLQLPKDTPITLPPGTEISQDLAEAILKQAMDLKLPPGTKLNDLSMRLPEGAEIKIPEGSLVSDGKVSLSKDTTVTFPDGSTFTLPKDAQIDLPEDMKDDLPNGRLSGDQTLKIDNPGGASIDVSNLKLPDGTSLKLPAGTKLRLPPGSKFPAAPGVLASALSYLLPKGTTFAMPPSDYGDVPGYRPGRGGEKPPTTGPGPKPGPGNGTRPGTGTGPGEGPGGSKALPVVTDITTYPTKIRKSEPFVVTGFVASTTGSPVAGAPIEIYLNVTKYAIGNLVGSGMTDADGRFRVEGRFPDDLEARQYNLLSRSRAFTTPSGVSFAEGWSDPLVDVTAATRLDLIGPSTAGVNAVVSLVGTLVDEAGVPVSGAGITFYVSNVREGRAVTDREGSFAWGVSFSRPGTYTVEARFAGSEHHEASSDSIQITISNVGLEVPALVTTSPGASFTIDGRLLVSGSPQPGASLSGQFVDAGLKSAARTDALGRFKLSFLAPAHLAPGDYVARIEADDYGISTRAPVRVEIKGTLALEAPERGALGATAPVRATLLDEARKPIPHALVALQWEGPGGSRQNVERTDSNGLAIFQVSAVENKPGVHTVSAISAQPYVDARSTKSERIDFRELVVAWETPTEVIRTEPRPFTGLVRFGGAPLAHGELVIDGEPLRLDADGLLTWTPQTSTATTLGPALVGVQLIDPPWAGALAYVVYARPSITLEAVSPLETDGSLRINATLVDDAGVAIEGMALALGLTTDAEKEVDAVATDRALAPSDSTGRFPLFEAALGPLDVGDAVLVVARSPAADGRWYKEAETKLVLTVAAPPQNVNLEGVLLPGVAVAAFAGGAGYVYWRRTRVSVAAALVTAPSVAVVQSTQAVFEFELAGAPPPLPAVWGVGEPFVLAARARQPVGAHLDVDGIGQVGVGEGRLARWTVPGQREGEYEAVVRAPQAEGRFSVRIVEYKREIAREFDVLLERLRGLAPSLDATATPREVQYTLEGRLDANARVSLASLVEAMEVANYSERRVDRPLYLRFMTAKLSLETAIGGAADSTRSR